MNKEPAAVIELACDLFNVSLRAITSRSRGRELSRARWAVFLVLRDDGHSSIFISQLFNRDHTTILYGLKKAETALLKEPLFARRVTELYAKVETGQSAQINAQVRLLTARLEGARKGNKTLLAENEALRAENKRLAGQVLAITKNRDHWKTVAQEQKPSTTPEPKEPKKVIMRLPDWMTGECKDPDAALSKVWPKNVKAGAM